MLERGRCGGVDTSYTTAHLTCVTDTRIHQLVKTFGRDRTRLIWDAGRAAIDQIFNNARTEEIDCNFAWLPGYLHAARGAGRDELQNLQRDATLAQDCGISAEFEGSTPHFETPGVKFAHQARFHPLRYLVGLAKKIPGQGSYVFERTEATGFSEKPMSVMAGNHKIHCHYIVLATHTPLMANSGLLSATFLQTKLYLYTSYAFAARVGRESIPDALFWDTETPYHYLRIDPRRECDYAIFGGEDHKTGQVSATESVYHRLERTLRKRFPKARPEYRWSGQVVETNDGLPFIGETQDRQFVATGFAGNGMTFGTLGGMMAVDGMERRKNPWAELFAPTRKKLKGGTWHYLKENKDYPYYLVRDWLAKSEGKSAKALKRNEGRILNIDGKKTAAYCDPKGKVSLLSPVCTHLGCIVHWNKAEKTWDCPCHGSRFQATGEVMSGPAEKDLEKISSNE